MRLRRPRFVAALKRKLPVSRQAQLAASLLPASMHFRFAIAASRYHGRLTRALGGNGALTEALMRDHWLRELTLQGAFPVPWRMHGRDVLDRYAVPGPVVYCSTHIPLNDMPLRSLVESGYPPFAALADPGRIVDGRYLITGMAQRVPAIPVSSYVLTRMRSLLQQGMSVACLADREFNGEFSANPLHLAGRMHVPLILIRTQLGEDGVVDVTFEAAPHPYCETDEAIAENMAALRSANDRVLQSLGVTPRTSPTPEEVTTGRFQRTAANSPSPGN